MHYADNHWLKYRRPTPSMAHFLPGDFSSAENAEPATRSLPSTKLASPIPHELQEAAVQLVPIPIFVIHIDAGGIKNAERTPEIPHEKPDLVLLENIKQVARPIEHDFVRGVVVAAKFGVAHPAAQPLQFLVAGMFELIIQRGLGPASSVRGSESPRSADKNGRRAGR